MACRPEDPPERAKGYGKGESHLDYLAWPVAAVTLTQINVKKCVDGCLKSLSVSVTVHIPCPLKGFCHRPQTLKKHIAQCLYVPASHRLN